MKSLSFLEAQQLARAVSAEGGSFYCRRLLQRLNREELELHDVLVRIAVLRRAVHAVPNDSNTKSPPPVN